MMISCNFSICVSSRADHPRIQQLCRSQTGYYIQRGRKTKKSPDFFFSVACVLLPSHGMESLFGLLEASRWISEILGREELKGGELSELRFNVASVSQSINLFSESLPPEDKEFVFKSNQVFPELAKVLSSAKQVLEKFSPAAIENGQAKEKGGLKSMLTASMKQGSRTLQDGLEAISGGVGNLASDWLGLPEDQLGSIRQANIDIQKLLPQLQLAISAVSIRSTFSSNGKRSAETMLESEQVQRPRTLADGEVAGQDLPVESEVKRPMVELKLVSDAAYAQDMEFPRLTTLLGFVLR